MEVVMITVKVRAESNFVHLAISLILAEKDYDIYFHMARDKYKRNSILLFKQG